MCFTKCALNIPFVECEAHLLFPDAHVNRTSTCVIHILWWCEWVTNVKSMCKAHLWSTFALNVRYGTHLCKVHSHFPKCEVHVKHICVGNVRYLRSTLTKVKCTCEHTYVMWSTFVQSTFERTYMSSGECVVCVKHIDQCEVHMWTYAVWSTFVKWNSSHVLQIWNSEQVNMRCVQVCAWKRWRVF